MRQATWNVAPASSSAYAISVTRSVTTGLIASARSPPLVRSQRCVSSASSAAALSSVTSLQASAGSERSFTTRALARADSPRTSSSNARPTGSLSHAPSSTSAAAIDHRTRRRYAGAGGAVKTPRFRALAMRATVRA